MDPEQENNQSDQQGDLNARGQARFTGLGRDVIGSPFGQDLGVFGAIHSQGQDAHGIVHDFNATSTSGITEEFEVRQTSARHGRTHGSLSKIIEEYEDKFGKRLDEVERQDQETRGFSGGPLPGPSAGGGGRRPRPKPKQGQRDPEASDE